MTSNKSFYRLVAADIQNFGDAIMHESSITKELSSLNIYLLRVVPSV
jgi:hypothetical protein